MADGKDTRRLKIEEELLEKIVGGLGEGEYQVASTADDNGGFGPTLLCPKCGAFAFRPFVRIGNDIFYGCFAGCGASKQVRRDDLPDPK